MSGCNPVNTPIEQILKLKKEDTSEAAYATLFKKIVGSLKVLCNSRPDIRYVVEIISRFICVQPKGTGVFARNFRLWCFVSLFIRSAGSRINRILRF